MKIGIPKEIKNNEFRVAMTPVGVKELVNKGHKVIFQKNAGLESNFSDKEYLKSGATIYETADDIYNNSEMILKVKEPIKCKNEQWASKRLIYSCFK